MSITVRPLKRGSLLAGVIDQWYADDFELVGSTPSLYGVYYTTMAQMGLLDIILPLLQKVRV